MIRFKYFIIIGGLIFFSCANKGLEKDTKKEGLVHSCPDSECDYSQVVEPSTDS